MTSGAPVASISITAYACSLPFGKESNKGATQKPVPSLCARGWLPGFCLPLHGSQSHLQEESWTFDCRDCVVDIKSAAFALISSVTGESHSFETACGFFDTWDQHSVRFLQRCPGSLMRSWVCRLGLLRFKCHRCR